MEARSKDVKGFVKLDQEETSNVEAAHCRRVESAGCGGPLERVVSSLRGEKHSRPMPFEQCMGWPSLYDTMYFWRNEDVNEDGQDENGCRSRVETVEW
jgi:hypothetical protein